MKIKWISLAVSVSVLVSSVAVFAEEKNESVGISGGAVVEETDETALNLLDSLEIINQEKVTDISSPLSRSAFSQMIARMIGLANTNFTGTNAFADITDKTEGYNEINLLKNIGIVSSSDDGKFNPSRNITGAEAIKLVVSALGYSDYVNVSGTYPENYIQFAARLGLLKGVSALNVADISYMSAAKLIYNALFVSPAQTYEDGGLVYGKVDKDSNILSEYFNVYEINGRVTSNRYTSIDSKNSAGEGNVCIDGKRYSEGITDISSYIGYEVTAYYRDDSKTIVCFYKDSTEKELTIDSGDIDSYTGREYQYSKGKNEKLQKALISQSADIIYNGVSVTYDKNIMIPKSGKVCLIDTNDANGYDIVIITSYTSMIIDNVNYDTCIATDKYSRCILDFSQTEDKDLTIKDKLDRTYSVDALGEWDVISFIQTPDKSKTDILLTRDYVNGKVSSIDTQNKKIIIGSDEYEISEFYPERAESKLVIGMTGDFLFDNFHKVIGYVQTEESQFRFGYLIGVKPFNFSEKSVKIKILSEDGIFYEFESADNVSLDGSNVNFKNLSVEPALSKSCLVRYSLNRNGLISSIDTADKSRCINSENDALFMSGTRNNNIVYRNNMFSGHGVVGGQTKVFIVPENPVNANSEEYYTVKDANHFQYGQKYTYEIYYSSNETVVPSAIVCFSDRGSGVSTEFNYDLGLIESISHTVDEQGVPIEKSVIWINGKRKIVYSQNDTLLSVEKGLGEGDCIHYATDFDGRITDGPTKNVDFFETIYDYNPNTNTGDFDVSDIGYGTWGEFASFTRYFRCRQGYVYLADNSSFVLSPTKPTDTNVDISKLEQYSLATATAKVTVYDHTKRENKIYLGSTGDLTDYVHAGDLCARVIVQTINGYVRNVIVYR